MANPERIGKIIYVNSQVVAREPAAGAPYRSERRSAPAHGSQRPEERARPATTNRCATRHSALPAKHWTL